jgi:Ca2+-binding RTX toxin-like protein
MMFFETLERRSLFSVSLSAGVLTVTGTNLNDTITVSKNAAGQVSVNNDGTVNNFAWASVNQIVVNALAGNDAVTSYNSMTKNMVVHGGDGNDSIYGGGGNDTIYGDNGNDIIDGRNGNDDEHGGAGIDTADYSNRTNDLTISLDDVANDGGNGGHDNIHSDFEIVLGGSGNDRISGNATTLAILGNGGNDSLYGGTSNAYIYGNDGNDLIIGGSGAGTSFLFGGNGNDVIYGYGNKNYIDAGAGDDYVNCSSSTGFTWAYGGDGNDSLFGGIGGSDLHGGNGNDLLQNSTTSESDWMNGDAGNDTLTGGSTNYNELRGGDGNDLIRGAGGTNWIFGDAGDDRLYAGYTGSNVYGGDGNDSLFGGAGADYLSGDGGCDILVSVGGGQNDHLHGGGNDGCIDTFWCDAEPSEIIDDADSMEIMSGAVHRVGSFANGASRELYGQNIADPTDSGTTQNYAADPLFSSNGPKPDDVNQGAAGDCYFLAALSATAKVDWIRIEQSVVSLGDGTYAVQFWKNGSPQYVRVDADLPTSYGYLTYAKLGAQNSLWVPIMEKAWAFFRTGANTYASTNLGWAYEGFNALNSPSVDVSWTWSNASSLLNYIQSELTAGKAVTIGTPATVTSDCPCVGSHAYMVDHVNYRTIYVPVIPIISGGTIRAATMTIISIPVSVTLRNPWGNNYGVANDTDPASAYVTVTAAQAFGSFDTVQSAVV